MDVSPNYWTECGPGEWGDNKNSHCGTSGLIVPTETKDSVEGGCYVQYKQVDSHIRKYRTRVCERCSSKTSTEEAKDKESWSVWGDRTSNLQDLGRPEEIKFKIKIRQLQVVKF